MKLVTTATQLLMTGALLRALSKPMDIAPIQLIFHLSATSVETGSENLQKDAMMAVKEMELDVTSIV